MFDYNSKSWRRKAETIRKRDNYLCVNCLRHNKTVPGTTVHHLYPVENNPSKIWDDKNLLTLCDSCHNLCHDRFSHKLTSFGYFLQGYYSSSTSSRLIIVCGAPCSGKTTFVMDHAARDDVVIDYDRIMNAITVNKMHDNNPMLMDTVNMIRRMLIQSLNENDMIGDVWLTCLRVPEWVHEVSYRRVEVVEMDTSKDECIKRLQADADGRDIEHTIELIRKF